MSRTIRVLNVDVLRKDWSETDVLALENSRAPLTPPTPHILTDGPCPTNSYQ
jgi:hypothetical protein